MRYALYWCPDETDPLAAAGATWLGRRIDGGAALPQPAIDDIEARRFAELTSAPRRYGFHATLKPPLALAEGRNAAELLAAVDAAARDLAPVPMPPLAVAALGDFIALRPAGDDAALRRHADRLVEMLDPFRRPPDAAEMAKRRTQSLSADEQAMLARWGYPYVFAQYRFHLTLSGTIGGAEMASLLAAAQRHFAAALAERREFNRICVCVEDAAGAPFRLLARFPLGKPAGAAIG